MKCPYFEHLNLKINISALQGLSKETHHLFVVVQTTVVLCTKNDLGYSVTTLIMAGTKAVAE